jgi:hypothetical protein
VAVVDSGIGSHPSLTGREIVHVDLLKDALLQLSQTDGSLITSLFGSGQAADVICQTLIGKTAS